MKAQNLFKDLIGPDLRLHSDKTLWEQLDIQTLTDDSRKVTEGSLFFALKGAREDGHDHLEQALKRKPAALCVEDLSKVPSEFEGPILEAESTREVFAKVAYRLQLSPADHWLNIGVTGTNGKTTIIHVIEHILSQQGTPTAVIGTVDHHLGEKHWDTNLTTPGTLELTSRLQDFKSLGTKAFVMEVSSHAIAQHRADGVPFNIGVFTNLTRDHLDFHRDMEEYFETKMRLFTNLIAKTRVPRGAVINIADAYGARLAGFIKIPLITFGTADADLAVTILEEDFTGTKFTVTYKDQTYGATLTMPSRHNIQNAMAALGVAILAGYDFVKSLQAVSTYKGVKGRLEAVPNKKGLHVFVDYAHTDDALKNVLSSLDAIRKSQKSSAKIITVFGCGGDRDRGKRPLMFAEADLRSDLVIVTSDNPRTEDPNLILDDILKNAKASDFNQRVWREVDRKKAIHKALEHARAGDVVLIAGKGHEEYQILMGADGKTKKHDFSDRQVVEEFLAEEFLK